MTTEILEVRELLRAARRRLGQSATKVSLGAGLSKSYVSKVEAGDLEPSLRAFARLAAYLQLSDAEVTFVVRQMGER